MKGGHALKVISTILEELQSVCNDISNEDLPLREEWRAS